jgi:TPR repeat protein
VSAPAPALGATAAIDVELIEKAKAGDAVAQYKLGYNYYLGKGIAQDFSQAAVWWQKAAEQGFPDAQNNLGVLYNSGKGVPQSYADAYFWQNLAAARANGPLQAQFAKNRDDSAAKLSFFSRMRMQSKAAKWAAQHPVPPRSNEPPPDHR